jgi:hypothetical protein
MALAHYTFNAKWASGLERSTRFGRDEAKFSTKGFWGGLAAGAAVGSVFGHFGAAVGAVAGAYYGSGANAMVSSGALFASQWIWNTLYGSPYEQKILAAVKGMGGIPGTSLSLMNGVLRQISPLWHGNIVDYITQYALPEQEGMRFGAPGNSLYKIFHASTFGQYKMGTVGNEWLQQADLPGRFYGQANGLGMMAAVERRVGADFMPESTMGEATSAAIKTRATVYDTWALGQLLERDNKNKERVLDPEKVQSSESGWSSLWSSAKSTVSNTVQTAWGWFGHKVDQVASAASWVGGVVSPPAYAGTLPPGGGANGVSDGVAYAHKIITSQFRGLSLSGGARSVGRNARAGGVAGSRHIPNAMGIRDANDYVGSYAEMSRAAAVINRIGGMYALVHDAGSGLHLHVQTAAGTQRGVVTHGHHDHDGHDHEHEHTKETKKTMSSAGGWTPTVTQRTQPSLTGATGRFANFIDKAAARFGVDRTLINLIIQRESGGRPDAISSAGAIGLMQVMPFHWGRHIRKLSDMTRQEVQHAMDPETNIMKGTGYFAEVYAGVSGVKDKAQRVKFALAGYNGGPGNLERARSMARRAGRNPNDFEQVVPFMAKTGGREMQQYAYLVLSQSRNAGPAGQGAVPTNMTAGDGKNATVQVAIAPKSRFRQDNAYQNADERLPGIRYAVMQGGVMYTAKGQVRDSAESMSADASDNAPYVEQAKYSQDTVFKGLC